MVKSENNNYRLEITCYVAFLRFLIIFGTFSLKVGKTWFVWHETWHTTRFVIYYCVEMVRTENIVISLKLRAKLSSYGFLSIFGTFSHKVI